MTRGRLGWREARESSTAWPEEPLVELQPDEEQAEDVVVSWETTLMTPLVASIVVLYAITFAILSILQHNSFQTNAFDLGNMDQAVWNTLHGRPLEFTNWEGGTTRLAAHVEPILFLVAPLYALNSSPTTLLVLQSVVLAVGAFPAFWLARRALQNGFAAAVCGFVFLLSPALEIANLADFHAVAFASTFLMFAFYYAYRQHNIGFFVFAVLAMSTKEHVSFTVLLMGLYIAWVQKRTRVGYAAAALGFVWAFVCFVIVLPMFNPDGASPYLSRYDQLGSSPGEMVKNALFDPVGTFRLMTEPSKLEYVRSLFSTTLYIALLSPATLAMALPDLGINLLSNFIEMYAGKAHYGAVLVPVITISTILGLGHLRTALGWINQSFSHWGLMLISGAVLLSSLGSFWTQVFLPLSDHLPEVTERSETAKQLMALIPPDAAVAASTTLNPHVSQRVQVSLFPDIEKADYIFLDVTGSPYPTDMASQWYEVQQLLQGGGWGIVAARDGYLLLRAGALDTRLSEEFFTFVEGDPSKIETPLSLSFGGAVDVVGYRLEPGTELHGPAAYADMTLFLRPRFWQASNFLVDVSVVGADGTKIHQDRHQATTLWYPATSWAPDELVQVHIPYLPLAKADRAEVRLSLVSDTAPYAPLDTLMPRADSEDAQQRLRDRGTSLALVELKRG